MPDDDADAADRAVAWATVAMYVVATAATALSVWLMVRDDPMWRAEATRVGAWVKRRSAGCAGCQERKASLARMWREVWHVLGLDETI